MNNLRSSRVKMTSITALTLHANKQTTSRRTSSVPQLSCKGKACRKYQPEVVQCTPMGEDGSGGLEWACQADLPAGLRFGAVEVSCEGYESSSDPSILKGSCGLEYNLLGNVKNLEEGSYYRNQDSSFPWATVVWAAISLYILYKLLSIPFARYPALPRPLSNFFRGSGGGGGGGGGGGRPGFGGGPAAPPPPYSKNPQSQPGATSTWTPGFWTGLAAGAAALQAGSMLRGNGNQQQYRQGYQRNAGWGARDDEDRGVGGSGWGRGAGGGGGFGGGGFGGGSGGGTSGGSMRSSTGFGGTRNR